MIEIPDNKPPAGIVPPLRSHDYQIVAGHLCLAKKSTTESHGTESTAELNQRIGTAVKTAFQSRPRFAGLPVTPERKPVASVPVSFNQRIAAAVRNGASASEALELALEESEGQ